MDNICGTCFKRKNGPASQGFCYCDYIGPIKNTPSAKGGTKHDDGKPPLTLVPRAAIEQASQVFAFGTRKYKRDNYKKGFTFTRLADAAMRHIVAAVDGEDNDSESNLDHIAHSICCLSMLLECKRLGTLEDDRYKKENSDG